MEVRSKEKEYVSHQATFDPYRKYSQDALNVQCVKLVPIRVQLDAVLVKCELPPVLSKERRELMGDRVEPLPGKLRRSGGRGCRDWLQGMYECQC